MAAALIAASMLSLASCKDDDEEKTSDNSQGNSISLDDPEMFNKGFNVGMGNQLSTLNIKSKGQWSAVVDPDCNWCDIDDQQVTYDGDKTLTLRLDANTTGVDRSTTLYVISKDGEEHELKITQGASDSNGSLGEADNWAAKGIGMGVDYDYAFNVKKNGFSKENFDPTLVKKNNGLFNMAKIEQLIASKQLNATAYTATPIELSNLTATLFDSTLCQSKTTTLELTLSVSFGAIEFSAGLSYNAQKSEDRVYVDYVISREAPMYNVVVSEAEIAKYAEIADVKHKNNIAQIQKEIEDKIEEFKAINVACGLPATPLKKSQQKIVDKLRQKITHSDFGGVFTTAFASSYTDLYEAVSDEEYEKADQIMNTIDNYWGPFYISAANFGGALTIHCHVNNDKMEGEADIEGNLNGSFAGAFDVHGEFSYSETGMSILRDINTKIDIQGGDANATTDALFAVFASDDVSNYNKIQEILTNWVNSMKTQADGGTYNASRAVPIRFSINPIWNLFADPETQEYAQNYFMKKYADRNIATYFSIMKGEKDENGDRKGASEALSQKEWDKNTKATTETTETTETPKNN